MTPPRQSTAFPARQACHIEAGLSDKYRDGLMEFTWDMFSDLARKSELLVAYAALVIAAWWSVEKVVDKIRGKA
jgi:hypothetical protein